MALRLWPFGGAGDCEMTGNFLPHHRGIDYTIMRTVTERTFTAEVASQINQIPVLRDVRIIKSDKHLCWKKRWLIWVLLAFTQPSSGTSVIVFYTSNVIYLAADSMETNQETGTTRKLCKFVQSGNMYWAAATDFYTYPYTGFDLPNIVASVGDEGSVGSKMDQFIEAVSDPLKKAIIDSKRLRPEICAKYAAGKRSPLQMVLVGTERGKPTFTLVGFMAHTVKGRLVLTTERSNPVNLTARQPFSVTGMGVYELALDYFKAHVSASGVDPVAAIKEAMKLEVATGVVGAPFSILRFDAAGPKWIEKGKC